MKRSFNSMISLTLIGLSLSMTANANDLYCVDKSDANAGIVVSLENGSTAYSINKYMTAISLTNCDDAERAKLKADFTGTRLLSYERNTKCMYLETMATGARAKEDWYSKLPTRSVPNNQSKFSGPGDIHGINGLDSDNMTFKVNLNKGKDGTVEIKSAKLGVDFKMNVFCE